MKKVIQNLKISQKLYVLFQEWLDNNQITSADSILNCLLLELDSSH